MPDLKIYLRHESVLPVTCNVDFTRSYCRSQNYAGERARLVNDSQGWRGEEK